MLADGKIRQLKKEMIMPMSQLRRSVAQVSERTAPKYRSHLRAKFVSQFLSRKGFSLVEVTLALGIMAVSFSVLFGLLGVGLASFRQSKAVSVSSQIAQQVFSQMQAIPFDYLVSQTNSNATPRTSAAALTSVYYANSILAKSGSGTATVSTLYFDDLGNQLQSSTSTGVVYTVNVHVAYPTPILPSTASSTNPVLNIDLATIMVQVALNPGNITPPTDPLDSKKWLAPAMQIVNYQFFVTRNN